MSSMSITRCLAELKRFDDRITREMTSGRFIAATVGRDSQKKMMSGSDSVESVTKTIQGCFDTVESLIAQRQKIKAAVIKSNAVATVVLGGTTMTVAEAIELKKSVEYKKAFVAVLQKQSAQINQLVDQTNTKLDATIDQMVTQVLGASDKSKVDTSGYESIATPQLKAKEAAVLDPKKITDVIKALQEEISLVETELDFLLSTSNAVTVVEV